MLLLCVCFLIITLVPYFLFNFIYLLGYKLYFYLIGFAYSNSVLYCYIALNTFMLSLEAFTENSPIFFVRDELEFFFGAFILSGWNFILSLISFALVHLSKDHVRTEAGFFINLISFFLTVPALFPTIGMIYQRKTWNKEDESESIYYNRVFTIPLTLIRWFFYLYPGLTYYFFYSYYYNLAIWPLLLAIPALLVVYIWTDKICKPSDLFPISSFPLFFYYFWFVNNIYQVFTLILSIFYENNDVIINK